MTDGATRVVAFGPPDAPGPQRFEVIVARTGDAVFGYVNRCAHMRVPLNLLDDHATSVRDAHIVCEHHYAAFRFGDGICVEGPCQGEALTPVSLAVRAGRVVIASA